MGSSIGEVTVVAGSVFRFIVCTGSSNVSIIVKKVVRGGYWLVR